MLSHLRRPGGPSIFGALLLCAGLGGVYLFTNTESEAFPGMPADQRAYWEWTSDLGRKGADGLESGFALLSQHPALHRLYGRLAALCIDLDQAAQCRAQMVALPLSDALAALYRNAALAQLEEEPAADWLEIASSPGIDPTVARQVVDGIRRLRDDDLLDAVEATWDQALKADSNLAGPAFGLGYAAVLRHDWPGAAPLLKRVTKILPNDTQAYRELGRMYFFQGDFDGFSTSLEMALENARRSYDLEQDLILRGNLGLGYLQWKGDLEKAGQFFDASLAQSRVLRMGDSEGFNYYRLANVRGRQYRYREAMSLLDSAVVKYEAHMPGRIAEVLVLSGMLLKEMYRFGDAGGRLQDAIAAASEHGDVPAEVQALIALVDVTSQTGQFSAALEFGERALELAREYGMTDYEIASRLVIGDAERLRGRDEAARVHYAGALDLARETRNVSRMEEACEKLGITALSIGDLTRAHEYFQQKHELIGDAGDSLSRARSRYWIGAGYFEYENYREALRHFDDAERLLPSSGAGRLDIAIRRNKAIAFFHSDRVEEARELLETTLGMTEIAEDRRYLHVFLGHVLVRQGHYRAALEQLERAEIIDKRRPWTATQWFTLYGKALAHWQLGERQQAEKHFREAVESIERLRDTIASPENRSHFIGDKVAVYENYSTFLEEGNRITEAFAIKERVRGRRLVDLLYTSQMARGGRDDDPASRAMELRSRMQAIERELARGETQGEGEADSYRAIRSDYLQREREAADELYRGMDESNPLLTFLPVDVDSIQSILAPDEALIAFNIRRQDVPPAHGPTAYVVLKDDIQRVSLPMDAADIREGVRFLRDAISSRKGFPEFANTAGRLYRGLIEPVRAVLPASVQHLHLVPEGVLHYLPFAALLGEDGKFLVEEYSLSVTPSATVLKLSRRRNPGQGGRMLLLADAYSRLPGARREVLDVAARDPVRRHVLAGRDVVQDVLETVGSDYDVIHFATHGTFDRRTPGNSHLELHGDVLTVEEIGRLQLNAYLITLSACETALASGLSSDVPEGDEWVGLNQAFLAAGTPTVMASLWPIDDTISSQFMVGFYEGLGPDGKAVALAGMQRAFLADRATVHPFYWAAFTVIGDPL